MRHRTKTLQECSWIKLTKSTNPKTGRVYYTVKADFWRAPFARDGMQFWKQQEVRTHFDPGTNRGSIHGSSWKFRDKTTAEQLIVTAILKWGG